MPADAHAFHLKFPRETSSSISETALCFSLRLYDLQMIGFEETGLLDLSMMCDSIKYETKIMNGITSFCSSIILYQMQCCAVEMPMLLIYGWCNEVDFVDDGEVVRWEWPR